LAENRADGPSANPSGKKSVTKTRGKLTHHG